jgi:hypothetical protein
VSPNVETPEAPLAPPHAQMSVKHAFTSRPLGPTQEAVTPPLASGSPSLGHSGYRSHPGAKGDHSACSGSLSVAASLVESIS